jgi:hypothetical protein
MIEHSLEEALAHGANNRRRRERQRQHDAHTVSASGPDHMRSAAGSEGDSHGSTSSRSSQSGASDAPKRHASQTHAVARATINAAEMESGRSATRESPVPVTASVPCDNHAASAVARSAITRAGRDTEDSRGIGSRMSRILHGATTRFHRGACAECRDRMRPRTPARRRHDVAVGQRARPPRPHHDDGWALRNLERRLGRTPS